MAQTKKSQAEKAADHARKKKSGIKKNTNAKSDITDKQGKPSIPVRFISSVICIVLFLVMLIGVIWDDGILTNWICDFVYGLIGTAGFVVMIPVLLYLFIIHAFSGKSPIKIRTFSLLIFVVACGAITHLAMAAGEFEFHIKLIPELYSGGIEGSTGGLLGGGLAMLLELLCGQIISYIILIVTLIISLLAGMRITIPSIIRAIQNRPRPDWDNEEEIEPKQEPATVVVNHFANKRIDRMKRRKAREEESESYTQPQPAVESDPAATFTSSPNANKAASIFEQIGSDVEDPVAVAEVSAATPVNEPEIIPIMEKTKSRPQAEPMHKPMDLEEMNKKLAQSSPAEHEASGKPVAEIPPEVANEVKKEKVTAQAAEKAAAEVAMEIAQSADAVQDYRFPPIDLLKFPISGAVDGTAEMRENTQRLNETLASFKIEAHIVNVTRGPSVTRYEVELEKGVRLNKLTSAADDIALSLGASGVRIAAIPGKISVVGIEVPNTNVTTVSLREVIDSSEFTKAKSKSSFAVGKDIGGACIVGNISKLPHMLIAGTTGSGKSVCMNSIIISLLYKASPEDVKLIMVDPKMVELGIYNGIPQLLIPVVTDPKKAAGSLQWAVTEMMRRYKAMSDAGVRDLESYNSIIDTQEVDGKKLPQIVVIIDELADLMLVAAKEVEESICRIAQMGRAAGIHLIIATQRPSADVITGLMKANIPSRIAFAVASAMESRIILDTPGAEKLVGKGDMLYAPIGNGKPRRVQGCFVTDAEVEEITTFVKENYITNYDEEVLEEIEKKAAQTGNTKSPSEAEATAEELDGDEMLPAAVDVIFETGQASVSMLQRRLKLGYARAARIVDEMEDKGIVGPFMGAKPRAILITKEQWEQMRSGQPTQMNFEDLPTNEPPTEDSGEDDD